MGRDSDVSVVIFVAFPLICRVGRVGTSPGVCCGRSGETKVLISTAGFWREELSYIYMGSDTPQDLSASSCRPPVAALNRALPFHAA